MEKLNQYTVEPSGISRSERTKESVQTPGAASEGKGVSEVGVNQRGGPLTRLLSLHSMTGDGPVI